MFPAYARPGEQPVAAPTSCLAEDEATLLAGDSDDECSNGSGPPASLPASPQPVSPSAAHSADQPVGLPAAPDYYYEERRGERGNLRVSTLYYPGRPEYRVVGSALGKAARHKKGRRVKRYWQGAAVGGVGAAAGVADEQREGAARAARWRELLAAAPQDEELWLQYIDLQETISPGDALQAALEARATLPQSSRVRARHHAAARHNLSADQYLTLLRDEIAKEGRGALSGELWARLVWGAAGGPHGGWPALHDLAAAAAGAVQGGGYASLVALHGAQLRLAGHWERLARLLQLQLALNYSCGAPPPPAVDEKKLLEYEDKTMRSGLPLHSVWCRIERARAAAHWAPLDAANAASAAELDPERAPRADHLAELLRAVPPAGLLPLAAAMLHACDVPLLWCSGNGAALRALHGCCAEEGDEAACGGPGALLALHAARPARVASAPSAARAASAWRSLLLLAADPPHCYNDRHGHVGWVCGLFAALCSRVDGAARDALLAWRVRWQRVLLTVLQPGDEEVARVRRELRQACRASPCCGALPLAELARLDAACAPADARPRRALLNALRHAPDASTRLYVARLLADVADEVEAAGDHDATLEARAAAHWALACGVLARALPDDVTRAPPARLLEEAARKCEEECIAAYAQLCSGAADEECGVLSALLPAADEWARARAALVPAARRRRLLAAAAGAAEAGGAGAARWREADAEALAAASGAAAGRWARALLHRHPYSRPLASMAGAAGPWAWGVSTVGAVWAPPPSPTALLAAALPLLLRAAEEDFSPQACGGAARRLTRLTAERGGHCGALLWTLLLEQRARDGALYRALALYRCHKWLLVRGAAGGAAPAHEMEALMLEAGLRVHALMDELH